MKISPCIIIKISLSAEIHSREIWLNLHPRKTILANIDLLKAFSFTKFTNQNQCGDKENMEVISDGKIS